MALTPADFDFEKCTVTINKSYQRLNGQDLITTPKTEKSNRVITIQRHLREYPEGLAECRKFRRILYPSSRYPIHGGHALNGDPIAKERYEKTLAKRREAYHTKKSEQTA